MIAGGQDETHRTATRLRRELDAVEVHGDGAAVDGVLRRLHQRRHAQRRQRALVSVTAAVVALALVVGGFAARDRGTEVPPAAPVTEWTPRGNLIGDEELADRARAAWPEGGASRVVYAGTSPNRAASLVVVVLVAVDPGGGERVGFATSPLDVQGTPDPSRLVLRATAPVARGQRAVGFVSATALPGDEVPAGGGSIGFALAEPGARDVTLHTSVLDDQVATPSVEPGVTWALFQTGAGAWNTVALVGAVPVPVTAGVADPQVTVTTLTRTSDLLSVPDAGRTSLLASPEGLLGVVAPDGTVTTDLGAVPDLPVAVAITGTPGTLTTLDDTTVVFTPKGRTKPSPGNRITLADPDHPEVLINVGVVTEVEPVVRVRRSATPDTATTVLRVDGL
ncbi:hypothetical protein UO65_1188 [Actinokineospora spheciospongiae]|uniref:Uncharacterized protein n=1 Tax=Actinokineospora spheciospongiae TaxID=909613 RepID=W7J3F0_9PSEU|nr:hypothetical protein [Actinokineospora spheciospongiae]EWC63511.1 hypothetical protein UO65_1188 [Actinokineospora spheciospongiae]